MADNEIPDAMKNEIADGMAISWDVPIEMDDGLVLRADVYKPIEEGQYPVIASYGPYAKNPEQRHPADLPGHRGAVFMGRARARFRFRMKAAASGGPFEPPQSAAMDEER